MKYFLIAGEASGDLHASNLMRSLKAIDPAADFRFFGGDLMQSVGGTLIKHYREMAYMGFIPVLLHLPAIFENLKLAKESIREYQPDAVILVDYPGFNLRIAKYLKQLNPAPRVYYYISPKIWAWKEYRIRSIKKYIDRMLCILPFEPDFYKKHGYSVDYVGNPTVDEIATREYANETFEEFISANQLINKPIIALLPGSRRQEIKDNLPTMLQASAPFDAYQCVIAGAPGMDPEYYRNFTGNASVPVVFNQTYRLLQQAKAALVTSGTATLETALLRTPQVVCYQTPLKHLVSFVWKHFFKVPYISLVNLIAEKTVVQELFGKYFSRTQIQDELRRLLCDDDYRQEMMRNYEGVVKKLGNPGAAERVAQLIYSRK
ncbi:MAG: lipid-A-disaccharide synthase [Dysgonamonadaceae bacterium]|jgi:lipid-A-disaccharide synthase|nr:lipid-A-disaccharide synthase [Dysgonamonadaceae bacterium]